MNSEQISEVVKLMQDQISQDCCCCSGNFIVFSRGGCKLVIKIKSPKINLYGPGYEENREFLRQHEADLKADLKELGGSIIIPSNRQIKGQEATWCSINFNVPNGNWFDDRLTIVNAARRLKDKVVGWNLLGLESKVKRGGNKSSQANQQTQERSPMSYDLIWNGWADYYYFWDEFIRNWFESRANPEDDLTRALEADNRLNIKELPEPYYGTGEQAAGVIVHLNPGASDPNENAKIFGEGGFLIKSFVDNCEKKYSSFARNWSPFCLNTNLLERYHKEASDVPGFDWWHKRNRLDWMKRFWGSSFEPSKLFILEACPYHSRVTDGVFSAINRHIVDKVVTSAIVAASGTESRCAVFVGKIFGELLAKINGIDFVKCWSGTRDYRLYRCNPITNVINKTAYLLVINGVSGMRLPSDCNQNRRIEREIHGIVGH